MIATQDSALFMGRFVGSILASKEVFGSVQTTNMAVHHDEVIPSTPNNSPRDNSPAPSSSPAASAEPVSPPPVTLRPKRTTSSSQWHWPRYKIFAIDVAAFQRECEYDALVRKVKADAAADVEAVETARRRERDDACPPWTCVRAVILLAYTVATILLAMAIIVHRNDDGVWTWAVPATVMVPGIGALLYRARLLVPCRCCWLRE